MTCGKKQEPFKIYAHEKSLYLPLRDSNRGSIHIDAETAGSLDGVDGCLELSVVLGLLWGEGEARPGNRDQRVKNIERTKAESKAP